MMLKLFGDLPFQEERAAVVFTWRQNSALGLVCDSF